MRAGVIVSLRAEATGLMRQLRHRAGANRTGGALVAISGMGVERATKSAEMLVRQGAEALVSWGTAGALTEDLSPGMLLLPHRLIGHDGESYFADGHWHSEVFLHLFHRLTVNTTTLVQSPHVVCSEYRKRALGQTYAASAVDMESGALARFAAAHSIPFVAVRAVADPVTLPLPEYLAQSVNGDGRARVTSVLSQAALRPADWPVLLRLALHFRAARQTLATAAECLSPVLHDQNLEHIL